MSFTSGWRDVRIISAAKAASFLGDEVATIALMLELQGRGAGALALSALLMANLVPIIGLAGVVGRLIDRTDARRCLVVAGLAQAGVCAVLAAVATASPVLVLALVCLLGAGQAVSSSAWQTLLPAAAGVDRLPQAIALAQVCGTAAGVAAPALSGVLTGAYGVRVPLLVDVATFLVVVSAAPFLRVRNTAAAPAGPLHGGWSIVRRDVLLRPLFALLALFVLLGSMVNVVDVFLVRDALGASATAYGLLGAVFAVGMVAGAMLGGRVRGFARLARQLIGSCVLLGATLAAMGLTPSVAVAAPIGLAMGLGNGLLNVAVGGLVMGRAVDSERGRVGAVLTGTASAMQLLAYLAGGLLATALGPREVFVLAGCLGLLAPVLLGRRLVRAADWAMCPTQTSTSLPSAGDSQPPAASPTPLLAI